MTRTNDNRGDDTRLDDDQNDSTKSPDKLEREVEQARARVGRTVDELSDRLSPGELIDQALGMAREHGGEFGRNLGAQVKSNPMPMILTTVGISWMMLSSANSGVAHTRSTFGAGSSHDGRNLKDAVGDTAAKTKDAAAAMGDRMHDATGAMGDRVHDASVNVQDSARHAQDSLADFYRDQPLLAGSLGIAIGAALGALVPPTEFEDDMFGETRDRSVDAAKSKASSKYDEVRESARK